MTKLTSLSKSALAILAALLFLLALAPAWAQAAGRDTARGDASAFGAGNPALSATSTLGARLFALGVSWADTHSSTTPDVTSDNNNGGAQGGNGGDGAPGGEGSASTTPGTSGGSGNGGNGGDSAPGGLVRAGDVISNANAFNVINSVMVRLGF